MNKMTSKGRMLAAITGKPVDRHPVAPIYLDLYLAEEVRRRALEGYRRYLGDCQEIALEPEAEAEIQAQAIVEAWRTLVTAPDWLFWMPLLPTTEWLAQCVLCREEERLWRIHLPSGQREELSQLVNPNDVIVGRWEHSWPASREEVDAITPVFSVSEILSSGVLNAVRQVVKAVGQDVFVCGGLSTPFWDCYFKIGFQGLMEMPYHDPELFNYLLERQQASQVALSQAYSQIGVDGIFIEECMTSADLISPKYYRQFVFPSTQAFLKEVQSLGVMDFFYYCGDVMPRLLDLSELSPTVLAVEESKKGFTIDLADVARSVGDKLAVFGNLDATQVAKWNDEELRRELRHQLTAARPARGFIFSMGSPFPLDTPRERIAAYIRIAQDLT